MKKLILILMLFAGISFAQTNGKEIGGGTVWTDSLGYTTYPDTAASIDGAFIADSIDISDSVLVIDMNFSQAWYRIFLKGNANAQADSIYYQHGSVRYSQAKAAVDTVWGSWGTVRDSAWTASNIMINNTVGKDFLLFSPIHQLLRFTLLNYRAAIPTRNCVITIQAVKK